MFCGGVSVCVEGTGTYHEPWILCPGGWCECCLCSGADQLGGRQ